MYSSCLHCTKDLGRNSLIEWLPVGERIAFDSQQGRLWIICPSCLKWNLAPFDNRLEAIDVCERLYRATPTRFATDNIGMAKHPAGLTLIRVGGALGGEFASWRYGEAFRRRRVRSRLTTAAIAIPVGGLLASSHFFDLASAQSLGRGLLAGAGSVFWMWRWSSNAAKFVASRRGRIRIPHPETCRTVTVKAKELAKAEILFREETPVLSISTGSEVLRYTGEEGDLISGRILSTLNMTTGSKEEIKDAVDRAGELATKAPTGSMFDVVQALVGHTRAQSYQIATQMPHDRLALEMHTNRAMEEQAMAGELRLLERQWRDADALAKYADGLVLPDLDTRRD